jgi:hypothetical protein
MKQLLPFTWFAAFVPFAGVAWASECVHKAVALEVTQHVFKEDHRPGRQVDPLTNGTNQKPRKHYAIERAQKLTDTAQKYGQRKVRNVAGWRKVVGTPVALAIGILVRCVDGM